MKGGGEEVGERERERAGRTRLSFFSLGFFLFFLKKRLCLRNLFMRRSRAHKMNCLRSNFTQQGVSGASADDDLR